MIRSVQTIWDRYYAPLPEVERQRAVQFVPITFVIAMALVVYRWITSRRESVR